MLLLPTLPLARAAGPVGGELTLDTTGSFQSYDYRSGWVDSDEQALREELRASFDGYLLDRAFATYRLGAAIDNRTLFSADAEPSSRLGYQYDARISVWREGTVPVVLYAGHQTGIPQLESAPSTQATSDTVGYQAGLAWAGLPKLDTAGRYQVVQTVADGDVQRTTNTELRGSLFQSAKSNHARAAVDWDTQRGPGEDTLRDRREVTLDVDARLNPSVEVVARADAHRYLTTLDDEQWSVGNTDSDALLRFRANKTTNGVFFVEQHRSMLDDASYGGGEAGGQVAHRFGKGFRVEGSAGATYDETEERDTQRYVGEYLRGSLGRAQAGGWGAYDATLQGGVAHFAELGVEGGPQAGGSFKANYARGIAFVRAHVGGEVAGMADASGLDQQYVGYGFRGGLTTQRLFGLQLSGDAMSSHLDPLARDDGDTDRLRVTGSADLKVAAFLGGSYSLSYDRLDLDDERSEGFGQSAQVDLEISGTLGVSALGHQTRWATSDLPPTTWWRVEGIVHWQILGIYLEGRVARDFTEVDGDTRSATKALVTATRRFAWSL